MPARTAPRIGVCSWSLKAHTPRELAARAAAAGVSAVQLSLLPLMRGWWQPEPTLDALRRAGLAVRSGMLAMAGEDYSTLESIRATGGLRPDRHWPANLATAEAAAAAAWRLRLPLVTFHAGAVPESRADPERAVLLDRLRAVADAFAAHGVALALETGQETAANMLSVLAELARPDVGINFDPANMLLYGTGDPVEALAALLPHVRQVHVKDARRATTPGAWGEEVPAGTGEVDWPAFFAVLSRADRPCDLMIEREAGTDRVADVRRARELVERLAARGARDGGA